MKKVMLVEDEELILQGVRDIIDWEEISMEVTAMAHNGREALEMYKENPVDIIVTDVEMPFMNGLKLLGEIRKLSSRTRCIILSGYDEFEYARTALKLDVEEYILKPIDEEQFHQALINAGKHLDEIDQKRAGSMGEKISWHRFLKGKLKKEEEAPFYEMLPKMEENIKVYAALMKIDTGTLENGESLNEIQRELQKSLMEIKTIYLAPDLLFLLFIYRKISGKSGNIGILQQLPEQSGKQLRYYELSDFKRCHRGLYHASGVLQDGIKAAEIPYAGGVWKLALTKAISKTGNPQMW